MALALALLAGCGGAREPAAEPLTAAEHEAEASREEAAARAHDAQYDPDARTTSGGEPPDPRYHGHDVYNPTASHLVEAELHRQHGHAHRERAEVLRAFEDAECARFPADSRASCPLLLGLEAVEPIEGGVRLRFAEGVDFASVVDHVRCHIAFAAAHGTEGISECALYVPGARVVVDGRELLLTTSDAGRVEELRRRVAVQAP